MIRENIKDREWASSSSSSSIGQNSSSGNPSTLTTCNEDGSGGDLEVQSSYKGPLDTLTALEDSLPIKRGISSFFSGKSRSFTSLSEAVSIKDLAKPDNAYNKRRNLLACSSNWDRHRSCSRNGSSGISKKAIHSSKSTLALAVAMSNSQSNSEGYKHDLQTPPLPPLPPQVKSHSSAVLPRSFSVIVQQYKVGAQILLCKNGTNDIPKKASFGGNDESIKPFDGYIWRPRASAGSGGGSSGETNVDFPCDYGELLQQVKVATQLALKDSKHLLEIEFPTAGLESVSEMLVVEELYKDAVADTERKLIIFNGELDRIRSGYYPAFFYPKLAALAKNFLPKLETAYYVHNFKGQGGGTLFRSYPGPWKVLRKLNGKHVCLHQQETMPSLKDVALNILPST